MSDSTIKTVSITGAAASDHMKNMNGGKRTRRRVKQMGGDDPEEEITTPVTATTNHIRITKSGSNNMSQPSAPAHASVPLPNSINTINVTQQQGGQKPKIVIAPKQKSRKIIIAPKHQQKPVIKGIQVKKRKLTKRLCVPITVVKNKIAKTRKHISESQQLPIDKIRKTLIDAKLLNPASKAPEALIRKIYADFKIIE